MVDYISALSIDFDLIGPEISLLVAASLILLIAFTRRGALLAPGLAIVGLVWLIRSFCVPFLIYKQEEEPKRLKD